MSKGPSLDQIKRWVLNIDTLCANSFKPLMRFVPPEMRTSGNPYPRKSVLLKVRTSGSPYLRKSDIRTTKIRTSGDPHHGMRFSYIIQLIKCGHNCAVSRNVVLGIFDVKCHLLLLCVLYCTRSQAPPPSYSE